MDDIQHKENALVQIIGNNQKANIGFRFARAVLADVSGEVLPCHLVFLSWRTLQRVLERPP